MVFLDVDGGLRFGEFNLATLGRAVYTQGYIVGNGIELTNAIDFVVGF